MLHNKSRQFGYLHLRLSLSLPPMVVLAEKVANHLRGGPPDSEAGMGQVLTTLLPALLDEVRKLLYALLWAIPFFVLSLVLPLIGPLLWFLFSAWILALEYLDYPMGNQGLGAREIRRRLRGRPVLSLGFGAATLGLTMIPLVNFIAMPSAVAGATALWVKEFETQGKQLSPSA